MTRSKKKRPPNAFLFRSFEGRPFALEFTACFSFSSMGSRSSHRRLYLQARMNIRKCPTLRGIGRAIVEAFAERGARIIDAAIDQERAADLALQIGQPSFSVRRLDFSAIGTIEGTVHEAVERVNRIDILVNKAAIFDMAPLLDVTPQSFERLFQVNVEGVFFFVLQSWRY
jgi:hypothetical protein